MATTPNFADLAQQQADQSTQNVNTQTTQNRPDQTTPWGSTNWTQDPTTGQWTQNTSLNPNQQTQLTNQQQAGATLTGGANTLAGQASSSLSNPMDWSGFMAGGDRVNGGNYYNDAATNALKDQFNLWNNDQFGKDEEALRTQLLNRGVNPTDAGYDEQLRQLRETQGKLRTSNNLDAILNGGAEAARMQGMDINAGNYNTSQRQSQIDEALQKRNQPLTDLQNINNVAGQVTPPVMPTFNSAGRADTPDLLGAAAQTYGAQLDSKNANAAKNQSIINGVTGLFDGFSNGTGLGGILKSGVTGGMEGAANGGGVLGGIKGVGTGIMKGFGLGGAGAAPVTTGLTGVAAPTAAVNAAADAGMANVAGALGAPAEAATPAAGGFGAAAGPAFGAAAALYTLYGAWRSAAHPGQNNFEGAVAPDGTVTFTKIPGGHDTASARMFGTGKDKAAKASQFYGPAIQAYLQSGDKAAAIAAMPNVSPTGVSVPPKQKAAWFNRLFSGPGNIGKMLNQAVAKAKG